MKKVLLFTIAFALVAMSDLSASCWRNRCNPCKVETACEPVCASRCEAKPTYQVIEDVCQTAVPRCIKYVPVEGTPICYKTCRFACPAGYEMAGAKESHAYELDDSNCNRVGY